MDIPLNQQDMYRILACLSHTAKHFEDEAVRQQKIATIMAGHPLGLLGAVIGDATVNLFATEGQTLQQLHAKLAHSTGLDLTSDPSLSTLLWAD